MELVYLWVDKYKNIKEQGFNFSPKFTCEYKDGNLTIKPKEHIKNFFDKKGKINITAIVGENGSGKSSLLNNLIPSEHSKIIRIYVDKNNKFYSESNIKFTCNKEYSKLNDIEYIRLSYDFLAQPIFDTISSTHDIMKYDIFNNIYTDSYRNIDLIKYKELTSKVIYKHGTSFSSSSKFIVTRIKFELTLDTFFNGKINSFYEKKNFLD